MTCWSRTYHSIWVEEDLKKAIALQQDYWMMMHMLQISTEQ
jgi:hypothetical protein